MPAGRDPDRASRADCPAGRRSPQAVEAASKRLLDGILGIVEVAVAADDGAEGPRRQLTQQALDAVGSVEDGHTSGSGALITWRTSMRWRIGAPPWPGAAEISAAISTARSGVSTSTMR